MRAPADRFFILLDGYDHVVRVTSTGEQVTALHMPRGQVPGIAKAFDRVTYPATAIAATESIALRWPNRCWDVFVSGYGGFATETGDAAGDQLIEAV